jgi:hypothetical protein
VNSLLEQDLKVSHNQATIATLHLLQVADEEHRVTASMLVELKVTHSN